MVSACHAIHSLSQFFRRWFGTESILRLIEQSDQGHTMYTQFPGFPVRNNS